MKLALKSVLLGTILALLATAAQAAQIEGFLVDKMCGPGLAQKGQGAQTHTVECNLMPHCLKAGLGVVTADNKYIAFDAAGNKKAEQLLRSTKKKDNLKVKVTGQQTGNTFQVDTIQML